MLGPNSKAFGLVGGLIVSFLIQTSAAYAFVANSNSGTFAAGNAGGLQVNFNSDNTVSGFDTDRGLALRVETQCGDVSPALDFTPDSPPAGRAQAHVVSAGASGVVSTLTFTAPGVDDTLTFGAFCLYRDSGGGFWAIERSQAYVDAGITACAPSDTFAPETGCSTPAPNSSSAAPSATQTQRVIKNFMSRRADQITSNEPDLAERLTIGGGNGSNGPVNFTANGTGSNNQASLSTSLRQVAKAAKAKQHQRGAELPGMMGLSSPQLNGTSVSNGFDVWIEGRWVQIDSGTADSDLGLLYVGADYRLSSSLLIGVLGQFDWSSDEDDTNNTDIDGRGWMVGPYVVARVHQNLIFDGRTAWGRSNNDVSPDRTYTDSFATDRWLVKGTLTGDFDYGSWHFAPHVGMIYFEEVQEGYTDSNGLAIGSQTVSLGRVTFGPKVSTNFQAGGGMVVSPHIGFKGIWDFDNAAVVDVATGIATGSDDLRGRVEGGMTIQVPGGVSLSGEGFYDGIGADDFRAYGGGAKLTVPLN